MDSVGIVKYIKRANKKKWILKVYAAPAPGQDQKFNQFKVDLKWLGLPTVKKSKPEN